MINKKYLDQSTLKYFIQNIENEGHISRNTNNEMSFCFEGTSMKWHRSIRQYREKPLEESPIPYKPRYNNLKISLQEWMKIEATTHCRNQVRPIFNCKFFWVFPRWKTDMRTKDCWTRFLNVVLASFIELLHICITNWNSTRTNERVFIRTQVFGISIDYLGFPHCVDVSPKVPVQICINFFWIFNSHLFSYFSKNVPTMGT